MNKDEEKAYFWVYFILTAAVYLSIYYLFFQ